MIKILFISALYCPDHIGGAEISTQLLAESLAGDGEFEVSVFCHGSSDRSEMINGVCVTRHNFGLATEAIMSRCDNRGVSLWKKTLGKRYDVLRSKDLISVYRDVFDDQDVIVVSGNAVNMGRRNIWKASIDTEKPLVQIIRDPKMLYFKGSQPGNTLVDIVYRRFASLDSSAITKWVAPAKSMIEEHCKLGFGIDDYAVIPNPITKTLCKLTPYSEKENGVVYVGALSKMKGVHTLIDAFMEMDMGDFTLSLIGRNEDVEVPNSKRVRYLGHLGLEETYSIMSKSKLLVLPSEFKEAFGRVLVESVFNGTVCLGSDQGGIPEVLGRCENYLFQSGNAASLGEKMKNLACLSEIEYSKVLQHQRRLCSPYALEIVVEAWKRLLTGLGS